MYHGEPGVISFGEAPGDRRMRMFYLYPSQFPEIYALEDTKAPVAETGVRRLLAIIRGAAAEEGRRH